MCRINLYIALIIVVVVLLCIMRSDETNVKECSLYDVKTIAICEAQEDCPNRCFDYIMICEDNKWVKSEKLNSNVCKTEALIKGVK